MDLVWAALAGGALALPASIVSLACAGAALIGAASVLPLGRFGIVLFPIGVAGLVPWAPEPTAAGRQHAPEFSLRPDPGAYVAFPTVRGRRPSRLSHRCPVEELTGSLP